jgi:hypothetical protein
MYIWPRNSDSCPFEPKNVAWYKQGLALHWAVVAVGSFFLHFVSLSAPCCVASSIIIAIILSIAIIITIIIISAVYNSFGHISWPLCVKCYQMSVPYLSTYLELRYNKIFYQCRRVVDSSIDCNDNLNVSWVLLISITHEVRTCENLFFILFVFDFLFVLHIFRTCIALLELVIVLDLVSVQ